MHPNRRCLVAWRDEKGKLPSERPLTSHMGGASCLPWTTWRNGGAHGEEHEQQEAYLIYLNHIIACLFDIVWLEEAPDFLVVSEWCEPLTEHGYHCHYAVLCPLYIGHPANGPKCFAVGVLGTSLRSLLPQGPKMLKQDFLTFF